MAAKTSNKGGRPPRAAGEKLQRINLTLRPGVLFALDMLARDRNISISQAVEFAFTLMARDYKIDGEPLAKLATFVDALEAPSAVSNALEMDAHDGREYTKKEMAEIVGRFFRVTGLARTSAIPDRLRLAEERYFQEVFEVPGPGFWTYPELFRDVARKGFSEGASPEETAREWRRRAKAEIASAKPMRKRAT